MHDPTSPISDCALNPVQKAFHRVPSSSQTGRLNTTTQISQKRLFEVSLRSAVRGPVMHQSAVQLTASGLLLLLGLPFQPLARNACRRIRRQPANQRSEQQGMVLVHMGTRPARGAAHLHGESVTGHPTVSRSALSLKPTGAWPHSVEVGPV
ncbi:hypothetical protein GOODEAATRI_010151 [Goodea atripinnis]|uniref:Uncharacterized protein n=1 Tax=Goodea atripinnis TaxID=208336 RepID=A0ABV0PWU0_9TELE